jgi:hypothetical protein
VRADPGHQIGASGQAREKDQPGYQVTVGDERQQPVKSVFARSTGMRRPPQRRQDEEQVSTRGGDPAAGSTPHEQDQGGHDPHPVMRPGDRRDQQGYEVMEQQMKKPL